MKIDYPKIQIDDGKQFVVLKEEQLLSVVVSTFQITNRTCGPLADKAFWLSDTFDWIIVRDDQKQLCLIPFKKKSEI